MAVLLAPSTHPSAGVSGMPAGRSLLPLPPLPPLPVVPAEFATGPVPGELSLLLQPTALTAAANIERPITN
jgi:hypothetical protein